MKLLILNYDRAVINFYCCYKDYKYIFDFFSLELTILSVIRIFLSLRDLPYNSV